jgi:hypothetical protein
MLLGVVAAVAVAVVFAARGNSQPSSSGARAAGGAGQQHECPPVQGTRWVFPSTTMKATSDLYESFATGVSCTEAALWTQRLAPKRVAAVIGSSGSLSGPSGFTCYGYPDLHGHAYVGSCVNGSATFGWNYNEMTIPAYTEPGLPKTLGGSTDVQGSLTALGHGRYRLTVQNISAKGIVDTFTWEPPELTITAVDGSKGGVCRVTSNGGISCNGRLRQPGCLCDGSGGSLTVEFSARRNPGSSTQPGLDGRSLHVTSLTPVPQLVPSTKQEQANGKT